MHELSPRKRYEQRERRRSIAIATASLIAVTAALIILVPKAPGWEAVKRSFFNWPILEKTFPTLLKAFLWDIAIFAWSLPLILVLSLAIALCRNVRNAALFPLRVFGALYTDIFRGVPTILSVSYTHLTLPTIYSV